MVVLLTLTLYGVAGMHCLLEGVAGFDFLRTCCYAEAEPQVPQECADEACAVERMEYRAEESAVFAPDPFLDAAPVLPVLDALGPILEPFPRAGSLPAPMAGNSWQFRLRAALLPRAPSLIA